MFNQATEWSAPAHRPMGFQLGASARGMLPGWHGFGTAAG
jgi:hypothetical protein